MRKRKDRTFDRYYLGDDGLRHVVPRNGIWSACGQTILRVKQWGGGKLVTCIQCLGAT